MTELCFKTILCNSCELFREMHLEIEAFVKKIVDFENVSLKTYILEASEIM